MANCNDCICSEVCYYKSFNDVRNLEKRRNDVEKICKSFVRRDRLKNATTVDAVEVKCKVGDFVHALWEAPVKQKYIIYCAEVKEIRIAMRNCRLTTTYILEPIEYRGRRREYRDDDFEKIVFLTEDAAKAALAKMDGGNEDA